MKELLDEGLIRDWGLSQVGVDLLQRAHETTPVSAVQNLYNMMERDCEQAVIPYCLNHNITVVPLFPDSQRLANRKNRFNHQIWRGRCAQIRASIPKRKPYRQSTNRRSGDIICQNQKCHQCPDCNCLDVKEISQYRANPRIKKTKPVSWKTLVPPTLSCLTMNSPNWKQPLLNWKFMVIAALKKACSILSCKSGEKRKTKRKCVEIIDAFSYLFG